MEINIIGVLVAVVANFILGFLWYTPLFGKAWAREMKLDTSAKPRTGQMVRGMIMMVVGNFLFAYVFAHNIAAWGFVPRMDEMSTVAKIGNSVFFTWLGFFLPIDLNTVAWEGKSWKLFAINASYHFMMLLVAAVVIYYV